MGSDTLLNYFRGGPIDNHAYETKQMYAISNDGKRVPIENYRWTDEILVSPKTGARARVWAYIGDDKAVEIVSDVPSQSTQSSDSITRQATPSDEDHRPRERKTMTDLRQRRDELGVSRTKVAELMGTTVPKVARIEDKADSKKTTDEERAAFSAALDKLEAELAEQKRQDEEAAAQAQAQSESEGSEDPTE